MYLIGDKEMSEYEISSGGAEDTSDDDDYVSAKASTTSKSSQKEGEKNSGEPGSFYEEIDKFSLKSEELIDVEVFTVDKII